MTRAELKDKAKNQLRGNWGWAICLFLVGEIITGGIAGISNIRAFGTTNSVQILFGLGIINSIGGIISSMIIWGATYTVLHFADTGEKEQILKGTFSGFTGGRIKNTFLTILLQNIFLSLWALLLIIPGVVKCYSYAMTPYIMKDMFDAGHKMKATEAITASRELMKGHKAELFLLDISFWGWNILGIITCGIGFIWIIPYYRQTKANFYRQLAGNRYLQK